MAKKQTAEYKNNFARENYDRLEIRIKKGRKAEIQAHAESKGESLNGFINRLINEAMEQTRENTQ